MDICKNIRFQKDIIKRAYDKINGSLTEIIDSVNLTGNRKLQPYKGHLAIKQPISPYLFAEISPEKYGSVDELISDITTCDFSRPTYKFTEFDNLQGLVQQLEDVQGLLKDQLQAIVDEIPNKNYQLSIEVCDGGIRLIHRLDMVETSCVIPACEITSKDELSARIDDFLNKL